MKGEKNEQGVEIIKPEAQIQGRQPGRESEMKPEPQVDRPEYKGSDKLIGKVALITGGDSGIGRAVAVLFAREGANVMIGYLEEDKDAEDTKKLVEKEGRSCKIMRGDLRDEDFCKVLVKSTIDSFGRLDIVVNNAAEQHEKQSIEEIEAEQLRSTFETNVFSFFYITQAALPHLRPGSAIINTTSVVAYKGSADKIDYAATKGAIVAFTRSLSQNLVEKEIRVNAVAPGPIWTPLIPATFSREKIEHFGEDVPMKRVGQPAEIAPCYVFLACADSSYITGQVLHPNGGVIVNG